MLKQAFAACQPGINLLVQPIKEAALDDMLVEVGDGVVRDVGKTLDPAQVQYRSLGVIVGRGDAGQYRAALDTVIAREGGILNFHHAIVAEIARQDGVHAIIVDRDDWTEIDYPEDIAAWHDRHL